MKNYKTAVKSSNVFIRLLVPYLVIFLIPISVWGVINYFDIQKIWENKEKAILEDMTFAQKLISQRFDDLDNIAHQISRNNFLRENFYSASKYNLMTTINELKRYSTFNNKMELICLYKKNSNYVITSNGYSSYRVYKEDTYVEGIESEYYRTCLNDADSPVFLFSEEGRYFHYAVPLTSWMHNKDTMVIFILDRSMLIEPLDSILSKYDGSVVVSQDGHTLITLATENTLRSGRFFMTTSNAKNLDYTIMVPREGFLSIFSSDRIWALALYILSLVMGALTLAYLIKRQFQPLMALWDHINMLEPADIDIKKANGIIGLMVTLSRDMLQRLFDQQNAMCDHIALRILLESEIDESIIQDAKRHGLLEGTAFFCMYLYINKDCSLEHLYIKRLLEHMPKGMGGYCVPLLHENIIGAMFWKAEEGICNDLFREKTVEAVTNALDEQYDGSYTVGVGSVYPDARMISRSFTEATDAIEYRLVLRDEKIFFYDMTSSLSKNNLSWYSLKGVIDLTNSVKKGDEAASCEILASLLDSLKKSGSPVKAKSMCTEITSNIIKTVSSMNMDFTEYLELFIYDSFTEYEEKTSQALEKICVSVRQNMAMKKSDVLFGSILEYIRLNLSSYELSMDSVSAAFGLSTSYIGKLFKAKQNISFTDYITSQRIYHIKSELITTDKPLTEIISSMGYSDQSSFIRKFKSIEGMTPGEFRRATK